VNFDGKGTMRGFAALLFSGLVAFGATAGAQPNGEWREHDGHWHERYDRRAYNVDRDQWVALANGVVLSNRMVRIPLNDMRLHSVELQATRGGADIIDFGVVYSDGVQEPIRINRPLDARHAPNLRVDLPRGMVGVRAIVVEGTGRVRFRLIGG